ncbi:hypothetical protein [Fervidibacillus albus]|uniref:SPOR domain-containing protein n=1 Tax=Fervidibacillus albus TaxID=2980026 RepID=A0A9E8LW83_9BACI|nr:hypothetical protein [Fervidibacillus albus]WAA10241.1 hypothetical protein OE104_02565 [Fervidibacillus albus]
MDKYPKTERKMTVKINGKEQVPKNLVIHNWRTKKETAVTKQEDVLRNYGKMKKLTKKKRSIKGNFTPFHANKHPFSLSMLTIIVASAVVIGLGIGFFLLKVMVKDVENGNIGRTDESAYSENVGEERIVIPSEPFIFLQQGVYQKEDSAKQLVADFERNELPASIISDGDHFRVFVATVPDENSAKTIMETSFYRDNYGETYPKRMETKERVFQNLTDDEKKFLESAYTIFANLVKEGSNALLLGEKYNGNFDSIAEKIEFIRSLTNIEQQSIQRLRQSLLDGYEHLIQYAKSRKIVDWQRGQANMLQFAVDYYSL